MDMKKRKIDELLFRFLENDISRQETDRLENWLLNDSQALQYYCEYVKDYAALKIHVAAEIEIDECRFMDNGDNVLRQVLEEQWEADRLQEQANSGHRRQGEAPNAITGKSKSQAPTQRKPIRLSDIFRVSGAIAAIVVFALLLNQLADWGRTPPASSVAELAGQIDARWTSGDDAQEAFYNQGELLYPGRMILAEGFAKITFIEGAEVILEAPAEVVLEAKDRIYLYKGRVYAVVPGQAVGFTLQTSNSEIIDLGTEFGAYV